MRGLFVVIAGVAAIVLAAGCKKNRTNTWTSAVYIPLDLDTLMFTKAVHPYSLGIPFNDVAGALVACHISGTAIDTAGVTQIYSRNWEAAQFDNSFNLPNPVAGAIFVNDTHVGTLVFNTHEHTDLYVHYDTSIIWKDAAMNKWTVSGSNTIPAFTTEVDGTYPSFTGTLPSVISKANDLELTFDTSNTFNADAAYVTVYSDGTPRQSNIVGTKGGRAIIKVGAFSNFKNDYYSWSHESSPPVFVGGGYILVVLHKYTKKSFGGKMFVFVNQRVMIGIVSFI